MIRKGKKLAYDIWYVSFLIEAKAVYVIDDNLNKWNNGRKCHTGLFLSSIERNIQSSVADFVFLIKRLCSLVSKRIVTAS